MHPGDKTKVSNRGGNFTLCAGLRRRLLPILIVREGLDPCQSPPYLSDQPFPIIPRKAPDPPQ